MGLTQKAELTGNPASPKEYTLTLEIKLTAHNAPLRPDTAVHLNNVLGRWSDGRFMFPVEMIHDGLFRCLREAMYQSVQQEMVSKYGNEMVEHADGKGATAKWYVEAKKVDLDSLTPYLHDIFKAKIERRV